MQSSAAVADNALEPELAVSVPEAKALEGWAAWAKSKQEKQAEPVASEAVGAPAKKLITLAAFMMGKQTMPVASGNAAASSQSGVAMDTELDAASQVVNAGGEENSQVVQELEAKEKEANVQEAKEREANEREAKEREAKEKEEGPQENKDDKMDVTEAEVLQENKDDIKEEEKQEASEVATASEVAATLVADVAEFPLLAAKGKWLRVVPSLLESLVPGPGGWEDGDEEATAARVRDHLEGKAGSNLAPMSTCQNFRESFEALPGMEDSNVDLHP